MNMFSLVQMMLRIEYQTFQAEEHFKDISSLILLVSLFFEKTETLHNLNKFEKPLL